jgi:hypothetical protein
MNFDDTARFLGPSEKLWPKLFAERDQVAITLCRDCRKVNVEGIRRYCQRCAYKRKLARTRESKRAKRGRDGRKSANSLVGVKALTQVENQTRCIDTPRPQPASFSSTPKGVAS